MSCARRGDEYGASSRRTKSCAVPRPICRRRTCRERFYPLVRDLAASGIPAEVSLQVLGLGRSPYYRWRTQPVTDSEVREAYLANAIFDAHRDDPEFGYRFLFDEVTDAGHEVSERTVWRICSDNGWWSVFGKKKRGKKGKVGAPAHDDLVRRDFTAAGPNQLWLTDLTEHRTSEGKLYLCAIKDVWSNRIVGYSISDRMESKIAVDALSNAVARRGVDGLKVAGCRLHSDRGSRTRFNRSSHHRVVGLIVGARRMPRPGSSIRGSFAACR